MVSGEAGVGNRFVLKNDSVFSSVPVCFMLHIDWMLFLLLLSRLLLLLLRQVQA